MPRSGVRSPFAPPGIFYKRSSYMEFMAQAHACPHFFPHIEAFFTSGNRRRLAAQLTGTGVRLNTPSSSIRHENARFRGELVWNCPIVARTGNGTVGYGRLQPRGITHQAFRRYSTALEPSISEEKSQRQTNVRTRPSRHQLYHHGIAAGFIVAIWSSLVTGRHRKGITLASAWGIKASKGVVPCDMHFVCDGTCRARDKPRQ